MSDSVLVDTEQSERRNHHHYVGNGEAGVVSREVTHVTVDSSAEKIQNESFFQCHHLHKVDFSNVSSLDTIGQWAFYECRSLCEMILPPSLIYIGSYAYYECSNLANVRFPNGLEVISASAFSMCRSLKKVVIPSTVRQLRFGTFSHCQSLESVELPSELESIASETFGACPKLKNTAIPNDTEVASNAFRACLALLEACQIGQEQDHLTRQNNEIIVGVLKKRFSNNPLHALCYHRFQASVDETADRGSESLMECVADRDLLGMMPLHILSISAKPNRTYIQATLQLEGGPDIFLFAKDRWDNTAFNYLVQNGNVDSDTWKETLANLFRNRVSRLGLGEWQTNIVHAVEEVNAGCVEERNQSFQAIGRLLKAYERKEKSSLLELYLWKHELDAATSELENISCGSIRTECRFTSYAEVVIPHVVVFL